MGFLQQRGEIPKGRAGFPCSSLTLPWILELFFWMTPQTKNIGSELQMEKIIGGNHGGKSIFEHDISLDFEVQNTT